MATKHPKDCPSSNADPKTLEAARRELQPFLDMCAEEDDAVRVAVDRLYRSDLLRKKEISGRELILIVNAFCVTQLRGPWERKSRAEQEQWRSSFKTTLEKLYQLLETGPYPPRAWGFPVRGTLLAELQKAMRDELLEVDWTILDALKAYQEDVEEVAEPSQVLAKPRDAKAARAAFLYDLQDFCPQLKAATVAAIATLLFDEEVDERKVRQHRPKHAGRIKRTSD